MLQLPFTYKKKKKGSLIAASDTSGLIKLARWPSALDGALSCEFRGHSTDVACVRFSSKR